jgi:hypothetical protein
MKSPKSWKYPSVLMTSNFIKSFLFNRLFIKRLTKHLSVLSLIAWLIACQPTEQLSHDLQDYQQRMARILKQDKPTFIFSHLPAYPLLKELETTPTHTSIKLSEFYQLQHCQLATLVAERNTVLGKLQQPSTRFIYEKQLIQGLQECLQQTQTVELKDKLQAWLEIKQQTLPDVWADMLQKSAEMRKALSSNKGFITGDTEDGLSETLSALYFLMASEQQDNVDSRQLEQHLYNLAQFALPATLWRSQNLVTENIQTTTRWLKQNGAAEFCHKTKKHKDAKDVEYLSNVFQMLFIKKIQPVATQINHYHYKLSPLLDLLLSHPSLSPSFKHYLSLQHQQGFTNYQVVMREHIELWQGIFKQCHIAPGKGNRMHQPT